MKKLLLIVLIAAGFAACKTDDKKPEGPKITTEEVDKVIKDSANFTTIQWLDSTYLDLGKVKEGKVVEVAFRFKNTGTKPLVIASVTASCGCTVPEKPEKAFSPGEEGEIKAKFDSQGRPKGENVKHVTVLANTNPKSSHMLDFRVEIE
jgi:hypothetical protein